MKIKKLLKGLSVANALLCLFGCIIISTAVKEGHLFHMMMPSHDYKYVLENGLKSGDHIKGDIYYNLGSFASESTYTQYETYRTASKTSGYYYVIPVGEYGYAAVYVRKGDKDLMEKMADETYEYMSGGAAPQTVLHVNGVAVKMEKSLKGLEALFKDQLKDWTFTDEQIEQILADTNGEFLVIEGPADVTVMYAIAGVGVALVALAVFLYIRRYKKEMAWEKKREEEWTQI